jgi:cysteinyl-tRNA synthetase
MAIDLLGPEIDIHTGGEDHVFPHHEDEIAQSEGATGRRFSRFWLHNGWLQIGDDVKMSKSLGNIYTLNDLMNRGIHSLSFRYFTLQAHYRTPLHFSWEALSAAQTGLYRLWEGMAELCEMESNGEPGGTEVLAFQRQFHEAINRDLDTSVALSVAHAVLGSKLPARDKLALIQDFDRVLALDLLPMAQNLSTTTDAEKALLAERDAARKTRSWALSDQLRDELRRLGVDVKDTPAGQRTVRRDLLTPFRDDDRQNEPG